MTDDEPNSGQQRLWSSIKRDSARMVALTVIGCLVLVVVEYALTLWATPAPDIRLISAFKLVFIELTLVVLFGLGVVLPFCLVLALGARMALFVFARQRALSWPGLWSPSAQPSSRQPSDTQPLAAWLWGVCVGAGLYVGLSTYVSIKAMTFFKDPPLTAFLLAGVQIVLIACIGAFGYLLVRVVRWSGERLAGPLGRFNVFGRVDPAALTLLIAGVVGLEVALALLPQLEPNVPSRHLLSLAILAIGMRLGVWLLGKRGGLLPPPPSPRRRFALVASVTSGLVLVPVTLLYIGADHEAKSIAITGSPLMQSVVDGVRTASDIDGDGYGFLLGENDCAPLSGTIHPLARDIPDNGIDEDCNGRDFSLSLLRKYRSSERMEVPEPFLRDWNFLLLTVDTVRYDHTGFGGYIESRGRDTTPNLDALVERSVSFDFAQAPSAGTMASIPAILTSKFFHSGIALEEKGIKKRMPPRLRPENLLIAELLEEQGYYSGAILSHEYFNDWGMKQGMDTYDNEIGKKYQPRRVTSHELTDKALAWVARNSRREKWFLWVHYLDPHGRYVEHPGEPSFGTTEEDLYDGEIRYTDKHIGRLLRELAQMPGWDRTIIIITSDHGDGFKEHGFINHGQALYRELLHIPLIFYIPDLPPARVPGAVSPIDIFPTMAELAGADTSELDVEGESLIPQLFYGKDAHDRVVFSETNWPKPLRAAITSKHKLIYKLQSNTYEFYDLVNDPWEKRNIYNQADTQALGQMKEYLDSWLERVYYARDPVMNQAAGKLESYIVRTPPNPQVTTRGIAFDDGHIQVLGFDSKNKTAPYKPGDKAEISVYMNVVERPSNDFRLQLQIWPMDETGERVVVKPPWTKSGLRTTARGLFPSSRWRDGEIIKDTFRVTIPKGWDQGIRLGVGLRVTMNDKRTKLLITGQKTKGDKFLVVLGDVPFQATTASQPPSTPGALPPGPRGRAPKPGHKSGPVQRVLDRRTGKKPATAPRP